MKPSVGLIGLGLMGRPMAANLLKVGYPLTVWNRTRARADELAKLGAKVASSPREAAAASDVLLTIVSDPPALEAVLWGPDGALLGLRKGSILVDSSTVAPELARRIAAASAERSADFLDAPVTGGTWGAEKGELVFMVGGKKAILDRVEPVLAAMGKRFLHMGAHGAGQTVKLAMNLILALEVQALVEALQLVTRSGVEAARLIEVLQSSMARAAVLDVKAPMILSGTFAPSFPLRLMHKDLALAMDLARQAGLALPAGSAAEQTYRAVRSSSSDDPDYAAVARFWPK